MLLIISPAKSLDFERPLPAADCGLPRMLDRSEKLLPVLRKLKANGLKDLMGLSDQLAELNHQRFLNFELPYPEGAARPAALCFDGDVYKGMDAGSLKKPGLGRLEKQLRILSGFYGLLRPLDLILPYRLEMGTSLKVGKTNGLYQFWGSEITELLNQDLEESKSKVLINCASNEYFKSVKKKELNAEIVTPQFKDLKNGQYKMISFFAKRARGMMVRYAIDHKIDRPEGLLSFDSAGYRYDQALSKPLAPVFTRDQVPR